MSEMKRFKVVSDLPEYTVWDNERQIDLFPTKSGNRDFACKRCEQYTASIIADALNFYFQCLEEGKIAKQAKEVAGEL